MTNLQGENFENLPEFNKNWIAKFPKSDSNMSSPNLIKSKLQALGKFKKITHISMKNSIL